jgi:hypothetical protein
MSFKEIVERFGERSKRRKEMVRDLDEQVRIQKLVEDRAKSANERELERFMRENREEHIKLELGKARKMRQDQINFGNNPLDVKNITSHTDWNVLKEKNLFNKKSNMFSNQEFIHKNNDKMFKSSMRLMN